MLDWHEYVGTPTLRCNRSLDDIERHLNRAYIETWRYIQVRIGYWKEKIYRTRTIREIADDAFGRWRGAGRLDY